MQPSRRTIVIHDEGCPVEIRDGHVFVTLQGITQDCGRIISVDCKQVVGSAVTRLTIDVEAGTSSALDDDTLEG